MSQETVFTIVRTVLKVGGGFIIAKGFADEAMVTELTGAIVSIIGVVWGIIAAKKAADAAKKLNV
jgi:hypothetical protein